ncbi:MAG: FHA domain-containing protein [Acidobacteria bacterium]|nr:MAG: FHA domain-containing protein [Acidobacteriota bacterium]REJ99657.1 MAG: FHA domain-containing protein [Acidobacteriota bacterium]
MARSVTEEEKSSTRDDAGEGGEIDRSTTEIPAQGDAAEASGEAEVQALDEIEGEGEVDEHDPDDDHDAGDEADEAGDEAQASDEESDDGEDEPEELEESDESEDAAAPSVAASSDEPLPFQLPEALVEDASRLVEERTRFEQLLSAAQEGRERVSSDIYRRVTGDYEKRLASIEEEYSPIRDQILAHVRDVMGEERAVRGRLDEINEVVEELRFRRQLGEFDDEEFDARRQESTVELTELDVKLNAIESLYRTVRSLLGRDAEAVFEGDGEASQSEPTPAPAATPPLPQAPLPADEASSDPSADQTAILPTIPQGASQSQTVIVASPGGMPRESARSGSTKLRGAIVVTPLSADVPGPVRMEGRELVLGRSTTCDVVLPGATVSRRHALLRRSSNGLEVEDISSGGGVLRNGERIEGRSALQIGDQLQIGSCVLRIDAGE